MCLRRAELEPRLQQRKRSYFFAGGRSFYLTIYSIITDGGNDANGEINPVEQIPSLLMLPLRNLLDGIK